MDEKRIEHSTMDEAQGMVMRALEHAAVAGHWMAVVWVVEDGKLVMIDRTTFKFPSGDFPTVLQQLSADFDKETSLVAKPVVPVPDPLPLHVLNDAGFTSEEQAPSTNDDLVEDTNEYEEPFTTEEEDVEQI